ncbi:Cell division coordinator CpoB [Gammaproteobacteria bacterium]
MKKILIGFLVVWALGNEIQAADKGRLSIEDRLERLERQAQSLSDLVIRLQQIEGEIKSLRGQLEVQQNQMENLHNGPQTVSGGRTPADSAAPAPPLPVEREEKAPAKPLPSPLPSTAEAVPALPQAEATRLPADSRPPPPADYDDEESPVTPPPQDAASKPPPGGGETETYQQAFELLNQGRYSEASEAFQSFLTRYPTGKYADNAQYWLGETRYATRNFPMALKEFQRLLSRNPQSPKAPGAMLKIGYIQIEQGETAKAKETLGTLVKRYPDTTEARLAQQRLSRLH